MRILVVGDSHGDSSFILSALHQAEARHCAAIVQVGDFGFYPHFDNGRKFLKKVSTYATNYGIPIYWLDGNHDNHPYLWENYGFHKTPEGFWTIDNNLAYIPRGHRWEWDGVSFVAVGGAVSIDKENSLEHERLQGYGPQTLWWPTEAITDEQIDNAVAGGKVDIAFTHDAPLKIPIPGIFPLHFTDVNRDKLDRLVALTRPDILIHGHYHIRYYHALEIPTNVNGELVWHRCEVRGLAHNYDKTNAWGTLDLDRFKGLKETS